MLMTGARSIVVKDDIVRDFNRYAVENLKRCVWSKGCTAWYNKNNGDSTTVTAMYPGSALHYKGGILYEQCRYMLTRQNTSKPSALNTSTSGTTRPIRSGIWVMGSWSLREQRMVILLIT